MIFNLDLYRNMKQGNRPQFKRQDTSSILTFFVSWPIQKDESNNEIISGEKNKVIKTPWKTNKNSLT